jgi:glycosyltransferase involved in cell wall biosynthesis
MRIIYLCPFTGMCGGTKVIAEHVTRLATRGHAAEWWGLQSAPTWFSRIVPYRRFHTTDELGDALQQQHAAIVATWWQTASWVAPNLRHGSRGFYLVQDIDELTYGMSSAGTSYKLGLRCITESEWVTRELKLRYGVDAVNVGIGIDHRVFRPHPDGTWDKDAVMTSYRPLAGPNDLKGWGTAVHVAELVGGINLLSHLITFGNNGPPKSIPSIPHFHHHNLTDEQLCGLYSYAGVYLMTSRHEGFGLPAAEAMACQTPVVCTDANGNMEFCRHGETAIVGRNVEELADAVLKVQRDGATKMVQRAFDLIQTYQWESVIDRLETLLKG